MAYEDNYNRINWEDYPAANTPLAAANLNKMDVAIKALSAEVARLSAGGGGGGGGGGSTSFPVGFILLTASNINPGNYFTGTWTQIASGLALVGAGTGRDTNGDSKTFSAGQQVGTYNTYEVVAHSHSPSSGGSFLTGIQPDINRTRVKKDSSGEYAWIANNQGNLSRCDYTSGAGSSTVNNVQPSFAVYVWRRTA